MKQDRHETGRTRRHGMALVWLLAVLLVTSTVPGEARGGHGGGHGGHHGGHGIHGFRHGHHGFLGPSIVAPIWPYWDPYLDPYGYPPDITPAPQVYIQPAPEAPGQPPEPPSWYYCDDPQGYYPYVRQCPGGWRPVAPTPP